MNKRWLLSIVVASMVLGGCRSGHHNSDKKTNDSSSRSLSLDKAKSIAKKLVKKDKSGVGSELEELSQSTNQNQKSSRALSSVDSQEDEICTQGGTMKMDMGDELADYINQVNTNHTAPSKPITYSVKMVAQNCDDGKGVIDGSITMKITMDPNNSSESTNITTFDSDFTMRDDESEATIKKGSTIQERQIGDTYQTTMNLEVTGQEKGIAHSLIAKNYTEVSKEHGDGSYESYPVSGKISIDGSPLLTVDPDYDASKTPIVYTADGDLKAGGVEKYLDEAGHSVEVRISDTKELTIWVDENGNGKQDSGEIETIEIAE